MKRLVLIRHAKSSWDKPNLADHDRPLNKRGRRNIERIREYLSQQKLKVDQVFSSSALRALTTARCLAQALTPARPPISDPALYQFDSQPLWRFLQQRPAELTSLALVGHNPAILELAERLLGQQLERFPTCALLEIELDIDDWTELTEGCGYCLQQLRPKQLESS